MGGIYMKFYVVRRGDSLKSVASRFGCDTAALLAANDIYTADKLVPGLALALPNQNSPHVEVFNLRNTELMPQHTYFSPVCAALTASGSLIFPADVSTFDAVSSTLMPILSIKPEAYHEFLRDHAAQDAFFEQLFPVLALRGFRGVLIENVPVCSFDRDAFAGFLTTLSAALHKQGCFLFTVLPAENAPGLFDGADCAALHAELADRIILYTAALNLLEKSEFIRKICRTADSRRLLLGFDAAAVKCSAGGCEHMSVRAALQLALAAAERIDYDSQRAVSSFSCNDTENRRQFFRFVDSRGLHAMLELADSFSLAGIAPCGAVQGIKALHAKKFIH